MDSIDLLLDPGEWEHTVNTICMQVKHPGIFPPQDLARTVEKCIITPIERFLQKADGKHDTATIAAVALWEAADDFCCCLREAEGDYLMHISKLDELWREWSIQVGWGGWLSAAKTKRQRAEGGLNSHYMTADERAERNREMQEEINRLCQKHTYTASCKIVAKKFNLSLTSVKNNTKNPSIS